MVILGIHDGHNATAALMVNGSIVASASEERFSRVKNDICHPYHAIDYVLKQAGITNSDIDKVYIATKETDPIVVKTKRESVFTVSDYVNEMHSYWKPLFYENRETNYWEQLVNDKRFQNYNTYYDFSFLNKAPRENWVELFNKERVRVVCEQLNLLEGKVSFVDHHTAHAFYAYHASPHTDNEAAVIITADSWGDGCNATISTICENKVHEIFRTDMFQLARIYRWITLLLGMKPLEHEYKVMGLAPYAKEYLVAPAYSVFKETLTVDGMNFRWNQHPKDMYFYFRDKLEGMRFDGIAGGLQLWLEEMLTEWIRNILVETTTDTVYYSGGVSMNVKANKVISELSEIRRLYVPPSGGDESLAMGAAYYGHYAGSENPVCSGSPLTNAYLGYEPSREESYVAIKELTTSCNTYEVIENPESKQIAEILKQGIVLGRCCGRMEFGARALGNRSILCDPSKADNLQKINEKIKFRDFWMPFTPSILIECADDYLINPKSMPADYMTIAFDSTPLARIHLKAAIHPQDFTIRPQLVSQDSNPDYYSVINEFKKITGIGAILNTSLNLHGMPIVCNAEDAIYTLQHSGLDGLLLPGFLILKK